MHALPLAFLRTPTLVTAIVLIGLLSGFAVVSSPMLILVAVAGATGLVVAWQHPGIVYAAYFAIPYYKGGFDPRLPVDLTMALAGLLGVAAIPIVVRLLRGEMSSAQRRALALWALPVGMVSIGAIYAPDPTVAGMYVAYVIGLVFATGLVGFRVATDPAARSQFLVTLFGVGILMTVMAFVGLDDLRWWERITALGSNTIGTAQAALLVPLIGGLYLWQWPIARPAVLAASAAALFIAVSTGSRGPVLMFAVTLLLFWLALAGPRLPRRLAGVLGALAVVAFVPMPAAITSQVPQIAIWRITNLVTNAASFLGGNGAGLENSARNRVFAWDLAVDLFTQRPLTGWGTASYRTFTAAAGLDGFTYPHNSILQVMAEYGVIGLLLMAVVFVPAWRASLRRQPDAATTALAALFVFTFLSGLVSYDLFENRPMWCMTAIVLALAAAHVSVPTTVPSVTDESAPFLSRNVTVAD